MADLQKIMGVAPAGIQKVSGIAVASIQKVMGLTYPSSAVWYRSNGDIGSDDMSDITDWADEDAAPGASTQATFDGKSCMKQLAGTPAGGYTLRRRDFGTFGARTVFSLSVYCDAIGTNANLDVFISQARNGTYGFDYRLASDGLFISDGTTYNEVGTDVVVQDTWQEWTFDVTWGATVDVYLGGNLIASDVDCSHTIAGTNGQVLLYQAGFGTANMLSYVDWIIVGTDLTTI
jgi:hypothetical protein